MGGGGGGGGGSGGGGVRGEPAAALWPLLLAFVIVNFPFSC